MFTQTKLVTLTKPLSASKLNGLTVKTFLKNQVKVARWRFPGSIPPKCGHKIHRHLQRFGKITATAVLDKDENLY